MIAFSQITQHRAASGVLIFHQLPRILNSWVYKTEQKQTDLDWIKWSQAEGASLRLELRSATTGTLLCVTCYLRSHINQLIYRDERTDKLSNVSWGVSQYFVSEPWSWFGGSFPTKSTRVYEHKPSSPHLLQSHSLWQPWEHFELHFLTSFSLFVTPGCTLSSVAKCMIIIVFVQ